MKGHGMKFQKANFSYFGGYLSYDGKFIARFKYSKSPFTKAQFMKELIANHTVESYLGALATGKAPLQVLRDANPDWYEGVLDKFRNGRVFGLASLAEVRKAA